MDDRRVVVAVRVRPKLEGMQNATQSQERYHHEAATKASDTTVCLSDGKPGRESKTHNFSFDCVFDRDATQLDVYEETTLDAVDAVLQGCNATIVTYGQTGSGKTYTVLGSVKKNPLSDEIINGDTGLFLRALKDVLSYAESRAADYHIVISLCVLEIYLEEVRDLLSDQVVPPVVNVAIIKDALSMPKLTYMPIHTLDDAAGAFKKATDRRVIRATSANDTSSRSHAVFSIDVYQQQRTAANPEPLCAKYLSELRDKHQLSTNTDAGSTKPTATAASTTAGNSSSAAAGGVNATTSGAAKPSNALLTVPGNMPPVMYSKLVLTDLAGSEKMKTSKQTSGTGFDELKKINGSLTALGNVVHALYQGSKHIPYRDAKLTIILRESFSAPNSKIVLIANISPTVLTFDESLSTLYFADKVKGMKVENPQGAEVARLELDYLQSLKSFEELAAEIHILKCLHSFDPILRRRAGDVMHRETAVMLRGMTNAARDKLLKQYHEPVREECRQAMDAKQQRQNEELAAEGAAFKTNLLESHKAARERLEHHLREQAAVKERDAKDFHEAEAELLEDIGKDEREVQVLTSERESLSAVHKRAPTELRNMDEEIDRLEAQGIEMDRRFMALHQDEESNWAAHQQQHQKQETQWAGSSNFAKHCVSARELRLSFATSKLNNYRFAVEEAHAKRDYERSEITQWIQKAVLTIARNAVQHSIRNAAAAAASSAGTGAAANGELRRIPSTRPVVRSAAAGGSSQHADPNNSNANNSNASAQQTQPSTRPAAPRRAGSTLYDKPSLVNDIKEYIQDGAEMLKYGRSGAPHYRYFYTLTTDQEGVRLCWDDADDKRRLGTGGSVVLKSVSRIILGQYTQVFQRLTGTSKFYQSFSVEYIEKQKSRTLDVVCDTEAEFESWVIGVAVLAKKNPMFGAPMPNVEMLPGASALNPQDLTFCALWHIQPQLFAGTKGKIEELRLQRQQAVARALENRTKDFKLPPLMPFRMTPGDLRIRVQLDIFRACALWKRFEELGLVENPLDRLYTYIAFEEED